MTLETVNWKFRFIDDGFFNLNLNSGNKESVNFNKQERFKIRIGFLLAESQTETYLIDLGLGSYPNKMFARTSPSGYLSVHQKLAPYLKKNITAIIFSHLHIDHMGGYMEFRDGDYTPNFPDIPCYINEAEWAFRLERLGKSDVNYRMYMENMANNVRLTKTGEEILPGISIFCTGGHTPGHQTILFKADETRVFYSGDLIATEAQMVKNRSLPYDYDIQKSNFLREKIYTEARKNHWVFALNHSPHSKFSTLDKNKKK